jgi:hypothetical protein
MNTLKVFALCALLTPTYAFAQTDWIAPEGKIINYRTLNWDDFLGKPDKNEDPRAGAAVRPAIYYTADSGTENDKGRVTFKFKVKCAFQSAAWVRENSIAHYPYYLNHEQEHYDIALVFANKLQHDLTSRDYDGNKYNEELHKLYYDLMETYEKTQDSYDGEGNHSLVRDKQFLWDMRIKKCMENNSVDFFTSPDNVVQTVKQLGQTVKRIPGEPAQQFLVRSRPIYTTFPDEMRGRITETSEWTPEPVFIACYTQNYFLGHEDENPTQLYTLPYAFVPNGKDTYKRVVIDTFITDAKPAKIVAVFFANADTDQAKELVMITTAERNDANYKGMQYNVRVYDNLQPRGIPARMKKLETLNEQLSGFEGTANGKPSKAKYKNEKDIREALKKMGYI